MFIVNNHVWKLDIVSPIDRRLVNSDGVYTLGVTDRNTREVCISNVLSGYMLDKVLSHEMVHVYMLEYDYDLSIETEELIADFVATYGRELFEVVDDILQRFFGVQKYCKTF